jgi:hypothetical protein
LPSWSGNAARDRAHVLLRQRIEESRHRLQRLGRLLVPDAVARAGEAGVLPIRQQGERPRHILVRPRAAARRVRLEHQHGTPDGRSTVDGARAAKAASTSMPI